MPATLSQPSADAFVAPIEAPAPAPAQPSRLRFLLTAALAIFSVPFTCGFVGAYLVVDPLREIVGAVGELPVIGVMILGHILLGPLMPASGNSPLAPFIGTGGVLLLAYVIGYTIVLGLIALIVGVAGRGADRRAWMRRIHVLFRYEVAVIMMGFAMVKVVPTQFGFLTPAAMLQPLADRNGFWTLWDFMAASTPYTVFSGLAELTGAVLLFYRRTSLLGSLILLAVMINVLALNVFYNVMALGGAVLILLMVMVLVAPALEPILRFVLRLPATALPAEPEIASAGRAARWGRFKPMLLIVMLASLVWGGIAQRRNFHGRGQPWFGAYDVTSFTVRGVHASQMPDSLRWRRVASDGRYGKPQLRIQYGNDEWKDFEARYDSTARVVMLTSWSRPPRDSIRVGYDVRPQGNIVLTTVVAGDTIEAGLRPIDLAKRVMRTLW